ncbi:universal stress protein [Priestia aryabhattai]|uniref:universal stress protein n=1 Tax=Priestia aryabhattai TaxID=412384 RepID=UPI0039A025DB
MYKKILVAFDGSKPSVHALKHGADLAKIVDSELVTVLHINQDLPLQEQVLNIDLEKLIDEEDQKLLSPAVQFLSKSNVGYEVHTFHGDPSNIITSYAEREHYDVIIRGNTGKGVIKEALLGSVSHKVAHSADCPVIL